jgi:hypothetical protein
MSVTFTASTLGPTASSFSLTSSSGVTGSGASSPLTLQEAATGTYTYSVSGVNANGTGPSSAASNSVVVASVFAPSGAYDSIATANGTGSSAVLTFSSIPATYTHLQIRFNGLSSSNATLYLRYNSDTGSNYAIHYLQGNGTAASAGAETTQTLMNLYGSVPAASASSQTGTSIIDILDYANTNKYKTLRALDGYDSNGSGFVVLTSGLWQSTSAITSITLTANAGNWTTTTTAALYGVKGGN